LSIAFYKNINLHTLNLSGINAVIFTDRVAVTRPVQKGIHKILLKNTASPMNRYYKVKK